MIIDNIKNASKYFDCHPCFKAAFEALSQLTKDSEEKKYVIDGEKLFINYSSYENKPVSECSFEAHKEYIDIQYVVCGHEKIDVCNADLLAMKPEGYKNGDIAFFENPVSFSTADLLQGDFVILFPGEAHRPLVAPDGKPVKMLKAIAKVLF